MPRGGGQGSSRQAPGRGWRVTQGCGKNVGHPLSSSGRPLAMFLFFFKVFKIKLHLTLNRSLHPKSNRCHTKNM